MIMTDINNFIKETLEVIKKRAYLNQTQGGFFSGLCSMLKILEDIATEYLEKDDDILKEINDLKKTLCTNE
jgi:hypothetical protein